MPAGHPLVLLVEENSKVEFLRSAFGFEVVSEEEDGYVLASTDDVDWGQLTKVLAKFGAHERGGGSAAKLYDILADETQAQRLRRILSDVVFRSWPDLGDDDLYTIDISVSCDGGVVLPDLVPRRQDEDEDAYARRRDSHQARRQRAMEKREAIMIQREVGIERLIQGYGGSIVNSFHEPTKFAFEMPGSFTVRVNLVGKGIKDIALNHPHVFQIHEVEQTEYHTVSHLPTQERICPLVQPPVEDAPCVCVIDSGIEEGHLYLAPAILGSESRSFIPHGSPTDTADYVSPNGHGTRVVGAVLYPRRLPSPGEEAELPCWIHNARVLDEHCRVPESLMPALYMEHVVRFYCDSDRDRPARIFNHSINSTAPYRHIHMSTWGAAIDKLSYELDVLIVQSAGNICPHDIAGHLGSGNRYPDYQFEASSRLRNPGQSLSAVTVGSVAHIFWEGEGRTSIAPADQPSAFSPAGQGIWGSIKPDVVEYGGDLALDDGSPPRVFQSSEVATELVRATRHAPGATSKDEVGTSFAAPRVSHIAAVLATTLPEEPCLLYRALIASSARWPRWAEAEPDRLSVLRRIGYGIPDLDRATSNAEHRVTLVSSGEQRISAREAHIYHIPVPDEMRLPEADHRVRIDVTLSYASKPRRTRRGIGGYLACRLDWKVSDQRESMESFRNRVFHDDGGTQRDGEGTLPWVLRERSDYGSVIGASRQNGTLQKDWCYIQSHELPPDFCIAIVGHPGWDPSPENKAKYAIAVSFEAVAGNLRVYHPIRVAVEAPVSVPVQQRIRVEEDLSTG